MKNNKTSTAMINWVQSKLQDSVSHLQNPDTFEIEKNQHDQDISFYVENYVKPFVDTTVNVVLDKIEKNNPIFNRDVISQLISDKIDHVQAVISNQSFFLDPKFAPIYQKLKSKTNKIMEDAVFKSLDNSNDNEKKDDDAISADDFDVNSFIKQDFEQS
jgi:hypothetical protein